MKQFLPIVALTLVFASCAPSGPIQRMSESTSHFNPPPTIMSHNYPDKDVYRVYQRGGSGFVPINAVRSAAEQRAEDFARRQGRGMVVLGDKIASPPYHPWKLPTGGGDFRTDGQAVIIDVVR